MTGRVRKADKAHGDDTTLSRWVKVALAPTAAPAVQIGLPIELLHHQAKLSPGHLPAIHAGRSVFHRRGIKPVADLPNVLVSGHNNVKIGRDVRRGKFRGYWIYTLSLEERATCPRSCHHWVSCYGNNMPFARRVDHRDRLALEAAIEGDIVRLLAQPKRAGLLVRLHALGDFFSPDYVRFWQTMLGLHDRLAVYGYTAWAPDSPVGEAVAAAKALYPERFAIRWSNGGDDEDCTQPIRSVDEAVNAIVCPEQTGRTAACATCGLCWTTRRNIAFLEH